MRVETYVSPTTKKEETIIFDKDNGNPGSGWNHDRTHPISVAQFFTNGKWEKSYDDETFDRLDERVQSACRWWCWLRLETRNTPNRDQSSYGLKHILEHDLGIYMTNNQFKDMMWELGYEPSGTHELNWHFYVKTVKQLNSIAPPENARYIIEHLRNLQYKRSDHNGSTQKGREVNERSEESRKGTLFPDFKTH